MWQNLKAKAIDAKTIANQANKTGGGPQPPQIGALETQVLAAIPNIMPTIEVDIDSDIMYVEDHERGADDDSAAWLSKKNRVTEEEKENQPQPNTLNIGPPQPILSIGKNSCISGSLQPKQTSSSNVQQSSQKRKGRNDENNNVVDTLRKKICLQELHQMEVKFELEKKFLIEKHQKEMEILEIKKQIALKELNK